MYHMAPSDSDWLRSSLMATRGVGGDRKPETHELTEEKQGRFHYTMGPYSDPVLHIKPGDRVVVQTRDAFEGKITKETDKPSQLLEVPFLNPQNGPIMVEGAQKGDALAVYIESMTPRGENPRGTCCMIPEFGALIRRRSTIRCPRSSARSISTRNGFTGARASSCRIGPISER